MDVTSEAKLSSYGSRLRYLRKLAGFDSQTDLATAAGLDKMAVSRAERAHVARTNTQSAQRIMHALRKKVTFDEPWLAYGVGNPPNLAAPNAIDRYLVSARGRTTPPDIIRRLRLVQWDVLGYPNPTTKQIHRLRELIETNLRDG